MSSTQVSPHPSHNHGACISRALHKATRLCVKNKLRFTPIRRRVLELVWASHAPVPAYELLKALRMEKQNAEAPTVYRALDFLQQHGMVHKIESLNAFVGCNHPGRTHTGHFMICTRCKQALEQESPEINQVIARQALSNNCMVSTQIIEIMGLCQNCRT